MERSVIESVMYTYVGDDGQFNRFLKSVIQEYVSDEMTAPMPAENKNGRPRKKRVRKEHKNARMAILPVVTG